MFNVITSIDAERVGKSFSSNKHIRKLTFTGSTRVGKLLMGQCAHKLKRASMELVRLFMCVLRLFMTLSLTH